MALMNCPECKKEISDQASNCPYCGYPLQQKIKEEQKRKEKEWELIQKQEQERIKKEKTKETLSKIKPIHIICTIVGIRRWFSVYQINA